MKFAQLNFFIMSVFRNFTEIVAWQKARINTKSIYEITQKKPFNNDFGLRDQIRRSAVSTMSNIAEGFGRKGDKEFARFLDIAIGSVFETQSHLFVALDIGYITKEEFARVFEQCNEVFRLINSLRGYLR